MKLKLFLLSIIALLSLVAYQKYSEYSALKFIDSYESCVTAKGSLIQESYPATCITRLGARFPQLLSDDTKLSLNTYDFCGSERPKTQFTLQPPIGWDVTKTEGSPIFQKYLVSNRDKTEYLTITCGTGFGGGGCFDHDYDVQIEGKSIPACTTLDQKTGRISINVTYFNHEPVDGNTFSLGGSIKKQYLDQILSTFKFTD